jgi:hypothetical protein
MIGDLLPDEKTAFAALQHSQKAESVLYVPVAASSISCFMQEINRTI